MHDGRRRVVELTHREHGSWFIDVGDVDSDADARVLALSMSDSNGGGWKFKRITDRFPEEAQDE